MKRILSVLLALCLVTGILPLSVSAETPASGTDDTPIVNLRNGGTTAVAWTGDGGIQILTKNAQGDPMADVSIPGAPQPGKPFSDVGSGWYKDDVNAVTGLGLFSGTSGTEFSPNAPMTRGMLATVLHRLGGLVEYGADSDAFADVPSDTWYTDAVKWAQAAGVVTGTGNGNFNPDGRVTREQLVTMLYRFAEQTGMDSYDSANLSAFPDAGKVSSFAGHAMSWAVGEGLVQGREGYLAPQGKATRAEVAAVLNRFVQYLKSGKGCDSWNYCERCGKCYANMMVFERICDNCNEKCTNCGTVIEYSGGIDGYCVDCYKQLFPDKPIPEDFL